ncbi:MAG: hypothetical protein RL410_138 [Actinomycetota bacterium]
MTKNISVPARTFSKIAGLGVYRPSRIVTNEEICQNIDSSDEWIRERTGITQRRFADADVTVVDMSVAAGEKAIADSGIAKADIDAVIVATISYPFQTPSAAGLVADRLGLTHPGAVDLSAACAGFTYALGVADGWISTGQAKNVLVVGVEKLSDWTDPNDRGTAFIFADGAGAVVVAASDTPKISRTVWGSDGSEAEAIITLPDALSAAALGADAPHPVLHMHGSKVFRWAVTEMVAVAQQALDAAGLTANDIQLFVPHQANNRITDAILRGLNLPDSVAVARDIITSGNTSAASIPLALDALREQGVAKSGDLALLIGFGAGLAYAAQVVQLP